MRKSITAVMTLALMVGALGGARASKPARVWEDVAGDADASQGLGASIPAGFDLVSGTIARDKENLVFSVTHADMPPIGSFPEATRFLWAFNVDGVEYRITVKRVDIGKPDVIQGQTTERIGRADVNGHFRLEGECTVDATLPVQHTNCKPLGYFEGTWDPAAKSFSFPVPMEAVGARTKSVITGGAGMAAGICQICWVSHYIERSLSPTSVIDSATQINPYKVPAK